MKILVSIISLFTLITGGFTAFGFYAHKEFTQNKTRLKFEEKNVLFEEELFSSKSIFFNFFYFSFLKHFKERFETLELDKILDKDTNNMVEEIKKFVDDSNNKIYDYNELDEDEKNNLEEELKHVHDKVENIVGLRSFFTIDPSAELVFENYDYGSIYSFKNFDIRYSQYFDYFINLKEKMPIIFFSSKSEQFFDITDGIEKYLKQFSKNFKGKPFLPNLLNKHKEFFKGMIKKYGIKIEFDSYADANPNLNSEISVSPSIFVKNVNIVNIDEISDFIKRNKTYSTDDYYDYFAEKYDLYNKLTEVFNVKFKVERKRTLFEIIFFFNEIYYFSTILNYLKG